MTFRNKGFKSQSPRPAYTVCMHVCMYVPVAAGGGGEPGGGAIVNEVL